MPLGKCLTPHSLPAPLLPRIPGCSSGWGTEGWPVLLVTTGHPFPDSSRGEGPVAGSEHTDLLLAQGIPRELGVAVGASGLGVREPTVRLRWGFLQL